MPSKKKKYNARFPPARIKKIMQTDEEIGKVAAAVPVIISRALELFLESLLTKACHVTQSRNAKTMTTSHLKQCIELEQQFDFLKDLVATVPDMQGEGEDNHTEGGADRVPKRGRKPGTGRKNGGAGAKGKDKKLSGTESEQEDESEDSETDADEEDGSQSSTNQQPAARFHSPHEAGMVHTVGPEYPVHYPPRPPTFHEPPPLPPPRTLPTTTTKTTTPSSAAKRYTRSLRFFWIRSSRGGGKKQNKKTLHVLPRREDPDLAVLSVF